MTPCSAPRVCSRAAPLALCLAVAACGHTSSKPAVRAPGSSPLPSLPTAPTSQPTSQPAQAAPVSYPNHRMFETAGGAMIEVMRLAPRVIGFGEYHEKVGTAKVQSPLKRFTRDILEGVADRASDLILELAVPEGSCGGNEDKAAARVSKDTKRPEATENEAVTLLLRAKRSGIRPSVLNMSCKEYQEILGGEGGEVDYVKLLTLITEKLVQKTREALARPVRFDSLGELRNLVLIYGGALHNDVYPVKELAAYSYAKTVGELTKGRYVEVDLFVPEYIEGDADLSKQSWYPLFEKHAAKDQVVLIQRGPRSFVLILQRGLAPPRSTSTVK